MEALYANNSNSYIYYFNVEEMAAKKGLILNRYDGIVAPKDENSYLTYARFTNEHNHKRKINKSIEVYYYMNRVGKKDKWVAGKIYALELEGIKINNKKPWGGLFPDVPTF